MKVSSCHTHTQGKAYMYVKYGCRQPNHYVYICKWHIVFMKEDIQQLLMKISTFSVIFQTSSIIERPT